MESIKNMNSNERVQGVPRELKLLCIGNSFSQDAVEHLYLVAKDLGIEKVLIGNIYKGGCSINTHYSNILDSSAAYNFFYADDTTKKITEDPVMRDLKYCIEYADWDIITMQQASNQSGIESYYENLGAFIEKVKELKPERSRFFWHMTWAYQSDSPHPGFANYGTNQLTMYRAIVSTVEKLIETNDNFVGIIPSGTAIQNLRTSPLGDALTRDGFHLSLGIGRYTAALTYLAAITGADISGITAYPEAYPEVGENLEFIKKAVSAAIKNPKGVTPIAW